MPLTPTYPRSRATAIVLMVYVAALVHASLYPWAGWREAGLLRLDFLSESGTRFWTWGDVLGNLMLYWPVGLLGARVLRRHVAAGASCLIALGAASMLSLGLESLQTLLPTRVPSRLDWLINTAGAALGTLCAAPLDRRLSHWMARWQPERRGVQDTLSGLLLLVCWLPVQWPPQRLLFGSGDLLEPLIDLLVQLIALPGRQGSALAPGTAAEWAAWLAEELRLDPAHTVLTEVLGTAAAMTAVNLIVREAWPPGAPRRWITAGLLLAACAVKTASGLWLTGPGAAFGWLTAGAQGGLLIGLLCIVLTSSAQRAARLNLALAALLLAMVLTSLFPADAYHASMVSHWRQGAWRNLDGLLDAVAACWPVAATIWCLARHRALTQTQRTL